MKHNAYQIMDLGTSNIQDTDWEYVLEIASRNFRHPRTFLESVTDEWTKISPFTCVRKVEEK
jgi:hypothetical protein